MYYVSIACDVDNLAVSTRKFYEKHRANQYEHSGLDST
jgi:hypothetical protein